MAKNKTGFVTAISPRQQIRLKQELDDVAYQTIQEIAQYKAAKLEEPVSDSEQLKWALEQNFVPQKHLEHRRSHPIFHDKEKIRPQKPKPQDAANVPPYNALDKTATIAGAEKTNKYPYKKPQKTNQEELRKAKTSTMGVLPNPRHTTELNQLNLIMEGEQTKPKRKKDQIDHVESVNTSEALKQDFPPAEFMPTYDFHRTPTPPGKMPAILSQTGTLGSIPMTQRPAPPQKKPSVDLNKIKAREEARKKKALAEKLAQEKARLEAEEYQERTESEASSGSIRSAKNMLEEAQSIASGVYPDRRRRKDKKKSTTAVTQAEKNVRTVDEIIASLKTQTEEGERETEADRQIKEIMERVMKHANSVLGNLDTEPIGSSPLEEECEEPIVTSKPESVIAESDVKVDRESATDAEPGDDAPHDITASSQTIPEFDENIETSSSHYSPEEMQPELPGSIQPQTPDNMLDLRQAYHDLVAKPQVEYADIVSVHGQVKTLVSKMLSDGKTKDQVSRHLAQIQDKATSMLTRFTSKGKTYREPNYERNVHLFCTARHGIQMPADLARATRAYHTPDQMKNALKNSWIPWAKDLDQETFEVLQEPEIISDSALARKQSAAARAILTDAQEQGGLGYQDWKDRTDEMFSNESLKLNGTKAPINTDETRTFYNCAPPKMAVMSSQVRDHLFPKYYGAVVPADHDAAAAMTAAVSIDEEDESDEEYENRRDPERALILNKLLARKYHSSQDLTHLLKCYMKEAEEQAKPEQAEDERATDTPAKSSPSSGKIGGKSHTTPVTVSPLETPAPLTTSYTTSPDHFSTSSTHKQKTTPLTDDEIFPAHVLKRCESAPALIDLRDDFLAIPEDFTIAMGEIDRQRKQIMQRRERKVDQFEYEEEHEEEKFWMDAEEIAHKKKELGVSFYIPGEVDRTHDKKQVEVKPTLAEQALSAGRNYVMYKKKSPKKQRKTDMQRVTDIEKFLYQPANTLHRTNSFRNLKNEIVSVEEELPERGLRVPSQVRNKRRGSLPDLLKWEEFNTRPKVARHRGGYENVEEAEREKVRDVWNDWFDEVFPPEHHDDDENGSSRPDEEMEHASEDPDRPQTGRPKSEKKLLINDEEFMMIEMLEPLPDESEEEMVMREALEEEVDRVKLRLDSRKPPLPFDYCRLGSLQRKLGQLRDARINLDKAVELEPSLLHAYWQRHLLHLLQGKRQEALEDLSHILKLNRHHAGAYVSRAALLIKEDSTMAVTNLTQAIKIQPENADIYMRRAEIYEDRGQVLLAMEDYAKAYKLNPKLTQAIFNRAKYYFKQQNWSAAINDFTEFLKKSPFNANARLLRGRAFTYLSLNQDNDRLVKESIQKAVQDLSAAIHMDPNNWEAFYYRGCIFRKVLPEQALLDYSMSILINDTEDNINALLHRGVLYDSMGQASDAIADFEAILKLRKDVAVAHLNLGLIYLTKMEMYQKAIRKFTSAIKCDPTFVRAYMCRAEAFKKIHDHKNASLDYTRAIHLRPEVPDFYMQRGMMLLRLGNTELASFCVRHVSELFADSDLGQSATQQAVVHSFLKNYPKAIKALDNAIKTSPNPPLYILLGKTQMKAKLWQEAIDSFSKALEQLKFVDQDLENVTDIKVLAYIYKRRVEFEEANKNSKRNRNDKPWKPKERWPKEAAEVNYLVGLCSLELRNYLQAHDAFNNAIEIDKKYAVALYQRGVAKLRLKQNKGLADINRALALDRTIFQAYLTRAAYYGMRGQISKAIMNCNEAIKLKPKSVRGYLYRGALKYHMKTYELAIKDLTMATKIDNQCALAYFNRAVCHHGNGNYQKALTDYSIVLLLGDQLMLKVLINRGLLYLSRGDYKNALHDFLLAAKVNNNDPKIRHTLGLCLHKLRRLKEAVGIFSDALDMNPFFLEAYISRGNAFLDYGNDAGVQAAQFDYEKALLLNPLYLPARVNLAYSLQMSGKLQQAWNQFTIAIEEDPRAQAAYEGRAVINLQMSNLYGALQDINNSINIQKSAELHTNRGVISLFMKDAMGAMHDFQAAIKNDPCYSLAYFNAANIYFKNRQYRQALGYYDRAIQFRSHDESPYINRAITKATIKDFEGAFKDFSQAIKISPKSAHIYFNRGNLYAVQDNWSKADADYSMALKLQPDDPLTYKRRADARGKLGMRDKAVEDYKYAIQLQARIKYLKTVNVKC